MIEGLVLEYLNNCGLDVPVYMEVPPNAPTSFVVIQKTGSGITNHIKSAMFSIQSYGKSMYEAAFLNEKVKDAMLDIIQLNNISRCALNSDYVYTDIANKKYRYQSVFDIVHY